MSRVIHRGVINLAPVTKKNSQRIVGKKILPSKAYCTYADSAGWYIRIPEKPINQPVNVMATYYMPTKRRVDLTNLHEALHDVLVKYRVLEDDNCRIIVSTDGSRVSYDKENPRTEYEITSADGEAWT